MARTTARQTNFAAGEISPWLWGRTELEYFAYGARQLQNYFVSQSGAPITRPGTTKLVQAKTNDVVLAPFVYSDVFSYVLELGHRYLRVHHPSAGYIGVELTTFFESAQLRELQWAQVGGVMLLTHPDRGLFELRSPVAGVSTSWYFGAARYEPPGNAPSDWQTLTPKFRDAQNNYRSPPAIVTSNATFLFSGDTTHKPEEWRWKVSALMRHNVTGEEIETLPVDVTEYWNGSPTRPGGSTVPLPQLPPDGLIYISDEYPVRFQHPLFPPIIGTLTGHSNWSPVGIVYYRGRGQLFGFVGTTRYAQPFVDKGALPDYARQPLRGQRPFNTTTPQPSAVAFFQQRRVLAKGQTLNFSALDDWSNHDLPFPPYIPDDAAMEFDVLSRRRESIRSIVAHRRLFIFTDSSVQSIAGADSPLTPTSVDVRVEDGTGASKLMPLEIDGAVLYVRAKGRGVRALSTDAYGAYASRDISSHAEHLFREPSQEIVSWCWQRDPWGTIWAARADGQLLSCTPSGGGLWAWSRHTMGDQVRSVACVPETSSDVVILAVTRNGTTWLERMNQRNRPSRLPLTGSYGDGDFALDAAVTQTVTAGAPVTITGLEHLEGRDVWVLAPGNPPQGPLRVTGGQVTTPVALVVPNAGGNNIVARAGLPFVADLELLDAPQARLNQKTVVKMGFEVDNAVGVLAGEDFNHLVAWRQTSNLDGYNYPSDAAAFVTVAVKGGWAKAGRAVLRQDKPQPLMILGVTRELDVGGS